MRLTDMWGKDVQLQASSNAIAQVIGGEVSDSIDDSDIGNPGNDVQMTGKWKSGADLQSVPSTSAIATVCVKQRGGSLAVVLNDEAGNARNIVLVEVELGSSAVQGARDELVSLRMAATGGVPVGCSSPVLHLDVSRAQTQKRLLVGWAHSTVAVYDLPDLQLRWQEVAESLHGVTPPEILTAGYVSKYMERRPQHLDPALNGKELGQNQQELDAFVIVSANDRWASGTGVNRHAWAGKAIFCHERDGIDMAARLLWASLNSDRVHFSGMWVCPSPHKLLLMGIGYMQQGPRAANSKPQGGAAVPPAPFTCKSLAYTHIPRSISATFLGPCTPWALP